MLRKLFLRGRYTSMPRNWNVKGFHTFRMNAGLKMPQIPPVKFFARIFISLSTLRTLFALVFAQKNLNSLSREMKIQRKKVR